MGDCHVPRKDFREAEMYYQKAMAIQEGKQDFELASTLEHYALVMKATGRASEAEGLQNRARSIVQSKTNTSNVEGFGTQNPTR
jgi:Tetratricopeptide repeat